VMANEPMFQIIRLVSVTPREVEVETITYSRKTETAKNAIIAASPVVPVHLKKYCRNPVVCLVVNASSHHD
jgi:hypothetical protein